jgi:hypothetical protein
MTKKPFREVRFHQYLSGNLQNYLNTKILRGS